MSFSTVKIKVPCGYQIKEKTKTVDIYEAYELLNTKKQHHYTKAEKCKDKAILSWHTLICPHCGKEIPSYSHYLHNNRTASPKKSESDLFEWAKIQMSLFESENNIIFFQQPEYYDEKYCCQKCGNTSHYSTDKIDIEIGYSDSAVQITREIRDFKELMAVKWISSITLSVEFPLYERIEFDFNTGISTIQLLADNKILKSVDLSDIKNWNNIDAFSSLICQNNIIKRTLKKFFQRFWQSSIPFTQDEISLQKLYLMTSFIDFPKEFYDAVPLTEDSNIVDESFTCISKALRNPESAMKKLAEAEIPYTKSIKRIFANKSGLFFYIEECAILFDILKDSNLFCKVLCSKSVFGIISMLHSYPAIQNFYRDYSEIKGKRNLCKHLITDDYVVNIQAVWYNALTEHGKKTEQIKWKENRQYLENSYFRSTATDINFSTPMYVPAHINDCTIGHFRFKWLRTKSDYQKAGEMLHNCLSHWRNYDSPVTVVYNGRKIVAAIEVCDNEIRQMFKKRNELIDEGSDLFCAIEKWCNKNSLSFRSGLYC